MSNTQTTRIFISHSSADANIGEKFLDALVSIGIKKEEVFYSSLYHTGVALGENFHSAVKEALSESGLVIFLLTACALVKCPCADGVACPSIAEYTCQ